MAQPSSSALSILQPDMLPAGVRTVSLQFSTVSVIGQEDQKMRELPSITVTSDGVVLDFFSFDFSTHHDAPIIVTLSYDPSRTKHHALCFSWDFYPHPPPLPPFCTSDASATFELRRGQDRSAGKCWSYTIKDVTPGVRLFAEVSFRLACVLHAALILMDSLRAVTLLTCLSTLFFRLFASRPQASFPGDSSLPPCLCPQPLPSQPTTRQLRRGL
jgi:hypothetical protein